MESIKLPVAFAIIVDDVGWHNGDDERYSGGPARSGIPRYHHPDDIRALNAIGKALNTKILCSLVLGDWDKNNRLRGVPHLTRNEEGWDVASKLDMDYANAYFEALEESEYLDNCLHGLMHSYYENGKLITARQYYPECTDGNGNKTGGWRWLPPEEFENMVKIFFDIYRDWGFSKPIVDFVSPCGCLGRPTDAGNIEYAKVLRKYGIRYWSNGWMHHDKIADTVEGVITSKGDGSITKWNAFGVNPKYLKMNIKSGVASTHLCGHLANFVRIDPEDNFEFVEAWADYFRRYTELFGSMLARDNAQSCSQTLYAELAKVSTVPGGYEIDLTDVDARGAIGLENEFFVSFKNGTEPVACEGGRLTLHEKKRDFKTYKIQRCGGCIVKIRI